MKVRRITAIGLAMIACMALTLTALGQFPGGRGDFGRPFPMPQVNDGAGRPRVFEGIQGEEGDELNPFGRLAGFLDLTEAQIASAQSLVESHRIATESLCTEAAAAREAARTQLGEGTDPTAIGNAVLASRALNEELRAANQQLASNLRSLLTLEQQERFDAVNEFRAGFGRRGSRGGPGGFGGGPPDMSSEQ